MRIFWRPDVRGGKRGAEENQNTRNLHDSYVYEVLLSSHTRAHTHTHIFRLTPFLVQIPCARIPSLFYSLLNSWTCTIKGRQKGIRGEFNDRDCKKPLIEPVICWRAWVVTYTRFAGFHYSKLAQRVTLLICIPGRPGSILVWDISHTDWDWSWISSMLQGKVWDGSLQ